MTLDVKSTNKTINQSINVGFSLISCNVSIEKIPSKYLLVTGFRIKAFHNCLVFMTLDYILSFEQIYL